MRLSKSLVVSVLASLISTANASPYFRYEVEHDSYSVAPGQSIEVDVYLTETEIDPGTSIFVNELGLWCAGVLVQRVESSLGKPVAIVGATGNDVVFDDFVVPDVAADQASASLSEWRDLFSHDSGLVPGETFAGSGIRRAYLGSFTFTAPLDSTGERTTFQVRDNTSDDTMTWGFTFLDPEITAASFTVEVVPEPGLLALATVSVSALALRRRNAIVERAL